jgi:sucrose-6F-phosphate phosphohydrolase
MNGRFDALLATDLDGTLVGDDRALRQLNAELEGARHHLGLAYVTGRSLPSSLRLVAEAGLLVPDVIIASVGSYIYDGPDWRLDLNWHRKLSQNWCSERVRAVAGFFPALIDQPLDSQSVLKCSYYLSEDEAGRTLPALVDTLKRQRVNAQVIYSSGWDLDILPTGSGKGNAVRYLARRLGVDWNRVLVCGDSGNDLEMLTLGCPAAVVANHQAELRVPMPQHVLRTQQAHAAGVAEALHHFGLLGTNLL